MVGYKSSMLRFVRIDNKSVSVKIMAGCQTCVKYFNIISIKIALNIASYCRFDDKSKSK